MTDTVQSLRDWAHDRESNDWGDSRRTLLLRRAADEFDRLQAERVALLDLCGRLSRIYEECSGDPSFGDAVRPIVDRAEELRRAAGLDAEAMTCPS